jgi:class 3 adenylate cyclase
VYRLAEAALYALAAVDRKAATALCTECLRPPVFSKILAIAAIHLLRELDWAVVEPAVVKLLASGEERYILLNLIDALSGEGFALSGQLVKALVQLLRTGTDPEVLQRAADALGLQHSFDVCESLIGGFAQAEAWRQGLFLKAIGTQIVQRRVSNREGVAEFLYAILRTEGNPYQAAAAALLWRLGDHYALKVLGEFVRLRDTEENLAVLRYLKGALTPEIVPILLPLLRSDHTGLQEALRETLLSAGEQSSQKRICDLVLAARGAAGFEEQSGGPAEETEAQIDLLNEKRAYRFERDYIQEVAILFTDIQGYSKKAQALTTMQLSSLIQEYEGILLPTVCSHRGELIKKMGDGHLFVFSRPLDSVLSAIRLQKALRRFNSYREETQRLTIRIGAHWGKVVRKDGDVLGNQVNLASRLESSAKGGSVLISDALHSKVEGHIHSRAIGLIQVKGFAEPVKVFEPYEISLDLPEELDPLKANGSPPAADSRDAAGQPGKGAGNSRVVLDPATLSYLIDTFSRLNELCLKGEKNQVSFEQVRKELVKRWRTLKVALLKGVQQ